MGAQPQYDRSIDPLEMALLVQQWGDFAVEQVALAVDDPFLTGKDQMLASNGRRAEICYVMHRGDPQAGMLLHIKTFYPEGAYRLPTGGIEIGESVIDTLGRGGELSEGDGVTQARVGRERIGHHRTVRAERRDRDVRVRIEAGLIGDRVICRIRPSGELSDAYGDDGESPAFQGISETVHDSPGENDLGREGPLRNRDSLSLSEFHRSGLE